MVVIENKLVGRIKNLADKNKRTFNEQLSLMVEVFEIMPIQKASILPGPNGRREIPVYEISDPVIQKR